MRTAAVTRIEQRGAVAFTGAGIAAVVMLLITLWGYAFDVTHYRPKERPNAVRVLHEKTGEENWVPLFDDAACRSIPN